MLPQYQPLVGCLLCLAILNRPDITYYLMWLGQYNACPTCAYFLIAKHVLQYLSGTWALALCLGTSSPRISSSLSSYIQTWDALMQIGLPIWLIDLVSRATPFISKDL